MNNDRQRQIEARRTQIPKLYLATYEKAIGGRSRKSAMHAFCLECCGWQIKEVFLCSDLGCPLYPYRPCSRVPQVAHQSVPESSELKNGEQRGLWVG